ncbi:cytochrome P450 6A1-like isoform X1 [Euwallacea similis]|uniref:cytochrome P450 6A1-like isoform X1 n=1 Tax=Euwallacea similis TaxID=1736056 RepID=UPI00344BC8B0
MEFTVLTSFPMFLLLVLGLVFLYIKRAHNYWKRKGVSQLKPNLIFGDVKSITTGMKTQSDFYAKIYFNAKSQGLKGIGIYAGWTPVYIPTNAELAKRILVKDFSSFDGSGMYYHEKDSLTMNIFFVGGDQWKKQRTKMTPIFTSGKLKQMFGIIKDKGETMIRIVQEHAELSQLMDIKDLAARYTTDTIAEVAFGLDSNTLRHPQHKLREVGRSMVRPELWKRTVELIFSFDFLGNLGHRMFPSDAYEYFLPMIKSSIEYREKTGFHRVDFLQLLMQLRNSLVSDTSKFQNDQKSSLFSEKEMLSNAFIIYAGGFETSSSTICFAMYELASNPEIQENLRKEIWDSLEKNNQQITYESVSEMTYLNKILKETLRKYPVLSIITRACSRDYDIDNTVTLKKGTRVIIPVTGLHWDPEFYPNPEQFNPENFSPEKITSRPEGTYLPFGDGPRLCIGMRFGVLQSKLALVLLIKDFRFTLDENRKGKPLEFAKGMFLTSSKNPIMIKATKI